MPWGSITKPRYMAFLPSGAMLPINSFFFGLIIISPNENMTMANTIIQAVLVAPITTKAKILSKQPANIAVVIRYLAVRAATRKQVVIIMPALRLSMPSGMTLVPVLSSPSQNCNIPFDVPSGPNNEVTITLVSTHSAIWIGNTSNSELNRNQNPANTSM